MAASLAPFAIARRRTLGAVDGEPTVRHQSHRRTAVFPLLSLTPLFSFARARERVRLLFGLSRLASGASEPELPATTLRAPAGKPWVDRRLGCVWSALDLLDRSRAPHSRSRPPKEPAPLGDRDATPRTAPRR